MASISTLPIPARFPDPFTTDPHIPERVIGERRSYRAVWVSDIHLGTRGCNAAMLIDFFDHVDCETLYLVGDIIDGWRLKKRHFWPPQHNDVVWRVRSEEHTSELQSLMRISYAVFCLTQTKQH